MVHIPAKQRMSLIWPDFQKRCYVTLRDMQIEGILPSFAVYWKTQETSFPLHVLPRLKEAPQRAVLQGRGRSCPSPCLSCGPPVAHELTRRKDFQPKGKALVSLGGAPQETGPGRMGWRSQTEIPRTVKGCQPLERLEPQSCPHSAGTRCKPMGVMYRISPLQVHAHISEENGMNPYSPFSETLNRFTKLATKKKKKKINQNWLQKYAE